MNNPWLEIPLQDYENHMKAVGQAQVLNKLVKNSLDKYTPESFALLGCAAGNGLEHVDLNTTRRVFALDINPEYLNITEERFSYFGEKLITCRTNIQEDILPFQNTDLIFAGLIFEYIDPKISVKKIVRALNKKGAIVIVIQKNNQANFVSKTQYRSLEKLNMISKEADEEQITCLFENVHMRQTAREEILLTEQKSFICSEYVYM